jgi:hypothetical protein
MDNKKFEKLIDLIINENEEQASELFHDIVVEKSKAIYESIMEDEMMDDDLEEGIGGQVGDLLDEINAEEQGVREEEDEIEIDSEEVFDIGGDEDDEFGAEGGESEVEDAVIRIEDKLDDLMAEFEAIMGQDDDIEDEMGDMDADVSDMGDEEVDVDVDVDDEELVAEAITLQKVTAKMGDNGEQTRSPVDANSGQKGMDGRPAPTAKDVDGASSFQNQPGKNAKPLSAAPKPVTAQASGVNTKSVID